MKSRFVIFSIAIIVCLVLFSRMNYSRKSGKKATVLRENEAQLKPHQQKIVDSCLQKLQKESFEASLALILKPQPDYCSIEPVDTTLRPFTVRRQISNLFFDRRKLKLNSQIELLPSEKERSKLVFEAFQKLFVKFEKTVYADFFTLTGAYPDGIAWTMYATARFGTPTDLLKEIDQVREAAKAFFDRTVREGRVRKPSREITQRNYPDNRVMLNCIVMSIQRQGQQGAMGDFLGDLHMEKLAVPQWDAPATVAEAGGNVFELNASYPAYVHIGAGWHEHILYDWPGHLRRFGSDEEQEDRLNRMIGRFRELVAKSK